MSGVAWAMVASAAIAQDTSFHSGIVAFDDFYAKSSHCDRRNAFFADHPRRNRVLDARNTRSIEVLDT